MNPELPALLKPKDTSHTSGETAELRTHPDTFARPGITREGVENLEISDSNDFDRVVERFLGPERTKFLDENNGDYQKLMRWQVGELEKMNSAVYFDWDEHARDAHKIVTLVIGYNDLDGYGVDGCSDAELMQKQDYDWEVADGYHKTEKFLRGQVLAQLLDEDQKWQIDLTEQGLNYSDQDLFIFQNLHLLGASTEEKRRHFDALADRLTREGCNAEQFQALVLCGIRNFHDWNPLTLGDGGDEWGANGRDQAIISIAVHHRGVDAVLRLVKVTLEGCGLPADDMLNWWKESYLSSGSTLSADLARSYKSLAAKNLRTVMMLHRDSPDLPKRIYEQFHIMNWAQYSTAQLKKQVDPEWLASRTDLYPVIMPRSDDNGAFHVVDVMPVVVEKLNTATDSAMVFECENKTDIFRSLVQIQKNCPHAKIKTLFLGAHGEQRAMHFGSNAYKKRELYQGPLPSDLYRKEEHLHVEDLRDLESRFPRLLQAIRSIFTSDSNIILASCSTGQDEGLAQELSRLLGVEVTAPTVPTHIDPKTLSKKPNGTFSVRYRKGEDIDDPTVQYYAGQAV